MKFQVVMTVEIPDEDTLHDKYDMTQADKALPAVREWFANTYRRPVTVTEARYIS